MSLSDLLFDRTGRNVSGTMDLAPERALRWTRRVLVVSLLAGMPTWSIPARAADALNPVLPMSAAQPRVSAGNAAGNLAAAERALELGLPTVAIALYQELLASPGADRAALSLPLATSLLAAGRAAEAEQVLNSSPGPRSPEWKLRFGLAAAQQRKFDVAAEQINQVNVDQLTRPDRAWFWFLRAIIAEYSTPPDTTRANESYGLAFGEADTELMRAVFQAAGLRARLRLKSYTPADLEPTRRTYEQLQDKGTVAYRSAETYAVMCDALGRKSEAVRFLSELLVRIPRAERQWTDDFRRLLGMIGDRSRGGQGRNALNQLLEAGSTPDYQRQALQLLAQDSISDPERAVFRAELDKVMGATPRSAIFDSLLLMRAQIALGDHEYALAERCANQLRDEFPGSSLRPHAFVILASSAWEQHRYRVAADQARQARETLAAAPAAAAPTEMKVVAQKIGELRVFEAEARFRAQDYRLAADAYATALQSPPAGIPPGDLMFQRALATIRADAGDPKADLAKVVDELEADPRFDPTNRWEAEWSLARGLKEQRKMDAALARVTRLLGEPASTAVRPELKAQMSWLQVQLSFDANKPELTLQLAPKLDPLLADVGPELRREIKSNVALLKAQAEFKLDREADALKTLNQLRTEFPMTDAAAHSYLITADYYAEPGRDKIQDAQNWLGKLIDDPAYKQSTYVPWALYDLAVLSEQLGQQKDLEQANQWIEELVKPERTPPPLPELVFAARLKQGDLLRKLNDFAKAQVAYEDLVNNPKYAQRPDVVVAQLRLAECHNALSSTDPSGSHADIAQSLFEELLYRVSAPVDVRVEAGYNLGEMLERRGQFEKARDIWWRDVITPFLIDAKPGEPTRATVPYWLGRTLYRLGLLLEQRENIDEARRVYTLLRDSQLGYESEANECLRRLGVVAAPKAQG